MPRAPRLQRAGKQVRVPFIAGTEVHIDRSSAHFPAIRAALDALDAAAMSCNPNTGMMLLKAISDLDAAMAPAMFPVPDSTPDSDLPAFKATPKTSVKPSLNRDCGYTRGGNPKPKRAHGTVGPAPTSHGSSSDDDDAITVYKTIIDVLREKAIKRAHSALRARGHTKRMDLLHGGDGLALTFPMN